MLRITTHDEPETLTFQLEGRLVGPWVKEFEDCWRTARTGRDGPAVRVNLSGVTFIDTAGKQLLRVMNAQGVEFLCAGSLMKAVVAEVSGASTDMRRGIQP
jgi:anti-anti-sigma regulatory factor